jgi:hypothetical protein
MKNWLKYNLRFGIKIRSLCEVGCKKRFFLEIKEMTKNSTLAVAVLEICGWCFITRMRLGFGGHCVLKSSKTLHFIKLS